MEFQFSAAKLERWMETTPREIRAGMVRALRRTGTAVQGTAVDLFRQRGIGRRIFGKKASGARGLITRGKLRVTDGVLEQPIKVKGLAAIQERGGRIKAHVIKPKVRKRLAFSIAGKPIVVGLVKHPGANMPAIPYLERAARQHMGKFREEVEKELAKAVGGKAA
jgi:hypothetical protein